MSDFFMSYSDEYNDYWKKRTETQPQNFEQNTTSKLSQRAEQYNKAKSEHYENWNRYGVDVPDEYYNVFNQVISKAENPQAAQEEAYRIGSAVKYAQMMNIPIEEAYQNVDAWNDANFTNVQGQKGRYESLCDMLTVGTNNVKLGHLGQKLMKANRENDKELAAALMAEIDTLNQRNELASKNVPDRWYMDLLKAGAQSVPFTAAVGAAGFIGNFIGAGGAAAMAVSSYLSAGQEYIDMIANGASPETAQIVSNVSGLVQGLIEADLGITKSLVKSSAKLMGKEVAKDYAEKTLEEIGRKVFKRFHFGSGKKLLVNYLKNYATDILGEGTEEFLQEITSIVGQEVAASLDGYDLPDDDIKSVTRQVTEAFKGGVLGAIGLGVIPGAVNTAADIKQYRDLRTASENVKSEEAFYNAVKDSNVFEGMSDEGKKEIIRDIWEQGQQRAEAAAETEARKIMETRDAAEGAEENVKVDEKGEEYVEVNAPARDEHGQLYSQNKIFTDDNGNETGGRFLVGDRTSAEEGKEGGARYGYINWEYDADDKNKIIIKDFKMVEGREGLRGEVYDDFAREHAGSEIEWNPITKDAIKQKESLIENNPAGTKNGLNYYKDVDAVTDANTRARVAAEIRKNIHDIVRNTNENGEVSYKRTELSNKQVASAVSLLEAAAKAQKMSLSDYVDKTFGTQIFGSMEEFAQRAASQGDTTGGKAGGMGWKQYGQQIKAVIYAGENADFSTWTHELAHIFQSQLEGDLKAQAEKAFNVVNGDWINSKYTFKDGHTDSAAEAFAYGFQDWLKTGKAESEEMKNIFQKFAEFIARAFNSLKDFINLTPEIENVYNQLLSGDDSLLKAAELAVEKEDKNYRAQLKAQAEAKENAKKAEAEQQKKSQQAEREEKSETTEYTEKEEELTPEQAEQKLDEVTKNEKKSSPIDNALKNTNLTDAEKTEIADVLKDENSTVIEKAEAITEAASSAYVDPNMFFQEEREADVNEVKTQIDYVRKQYEGTDQWMKAPNGEPSKLTEKQWLQVRTPNFKRWFGNWLLKNKQFNIVKAEKAPFNNVSAAKSWAEKNVIGLMTNEETNGKGDINISANSVDEMLNLNQRLKSASNEIHYATLTKIKDIIRESEIVDTHSDFNKDKTGKRTPLAGINKDSNIDVLYGALEFEGETYRVKTTIKRFLDKNKTPKAYAYNVQKIEVFSGITDSENNITGARENTSITGDILLRGVRKVNQKIGGDGELALEDYSRVLDENGEPLVVYHGTNTDFDVFEGKNNFHFGTKKQAELRINDYKDYLKQEIEDLTKRIETATSQTDKFNAMNALENAKSKLEGFKNPKLMEVFLNARNLKETEDENLWQEKTEKYKAQGYDGFKYYNVYENDGNYSYAVFNPNQIKSATDNNGNFDATNPNILFQTAYHGSPYNFENFSTESIGTGEGAQAFGWGLYFTNQEAIARFYADKLANEPKRISLIAKNEYLKSRKKSLRDVENKEKYEAKITKNINHFRKELKQAQKAGDEKEIKFYEGLIDDSIKQLDENERLSLIESFKKDIATAEQEIAELKASMKNNRNLYTVEIPDEGYVVWDKPLTGELINKVSEGLKKLEAEKKFYSDMEMSAGYNPWNIQYEEYMKAPEIYKGEDLYDYLEKVLHSDKAASLFLKDLGYIGIDYPAHSLSGYTSQDERNYVIFDEANANIQNHLLYQKAYHGSGADFEKFDTENYGFSGEGSMSFGYGTYLTDSEDIARDYADRQVSQKYADVNDAYNVLKTNILATIRHEAELKGFEKALQERKDYLQYRVEDPQGIYKEEQKANSKKLLEELKTLKEEDLKNRHFYTVEIPDSVYIQWDKPIRKQTTDKIKRELLKEIYSNPNSAYYSYDKRELSNELDQVFSYVEGMQLYNNVSAYLEGDEAASKFFHKIGYAGIKYPAGTIHGGGNGAYNYVIFNDEDAKIVDHLFFQTQAELEDEARSFDSWPEFMSWCETMHADDEVSPIPSTADAQWYQSFWEAANGMQTEAEQNEQEVQQKYDNESSRPMAMDALFITSMRSNPEMLDDFLHTVARIDAVDFNSEEWAQVADEEDAAYREKLADLKNFISYTLHDYSWGSAIKKIQGGGEITEGHRKRLLGEITNDFKARDFRALYAEVMNDPQFAVAEEDSIAHQLAEKLSSKKYKDILQPGEDISKVSPERRRQVAEEMSNREIAAKFANGTLKLNDEVDAYFKSLKKQVKEAQKKLDELELETKADYKRIAGAETKDLLKLHENLILARGRMQTNDREIQRKIDKGLKITEKYQKQSQNLKADYNEIFRKFSDLKKTIAITAEVQAALDRQEQVAEVKQDLNQKQKDKSLAAEIKKMRIQLVKRTMRRVPFNRIDYEKAKTIIAIQRMLEPNLLGGVNRFIGVDSAFLRGVISGIVTDSEYKQKILNYLSKTPKASKAFAEFKKKIEELKSIKDFDTWTARERKNAIRYLPKENWVRELNLNQLAKEREEAIDLDIETIEKTVMKMNPETGLPMTDKEGNKLTETAFSLKVSDEIAQLVKDAVGADMFDLIVNKPFSEWTTEELEQLAQRIDELYTEGRELKAAKDEARRKEAERIRLKIENAIKDTGIVINDDDPPEVKEKKLKKINKVLGLDSDLKGTEAAKDTGIKAKFNRLIHGYSDANILRVARLLDNQSEGENVRQLYRREDVCFNNKQRSINKRSEKIKAVMKENNITEESLMQTVSALGTSFTVDELLYFLAADKDFEEDEKKLAKGFIGVDANDDYAATSRNAVMFGNIMSDMTSQEVKERYAGMDKERKEAIANDTLTAEERQLQAEGKLDPHPGTTQYIANCHARWETVLGVANNYLSNHPEYKALMEAIEADYAEQYERMNKISIEEFNAPVHRVKAYVPLVRRESNGDTNVNQVREDLLGAYGGETKQWVNKGMTQRRVNISPLNQKPVQTGLFRTWADSIDRTEHFIAYAPYVRQLNAIYKSRDAAYTRRFIEARYGKPMLEYIDSYINEVANPNAGKIREKGAEFLHVLRGKTAPAYLGWKFSAIVKQAATSPWPYMQFVNPAEYFAAATKCWTSGGKVYDAIKEKSAFMASRVMDPINELVDEMAEQAKTKADRAWSNFSKKGMAGLEWIDWTCVAPGWLACYEKEYNRLQAMTEARYQAKVAELQERNQYEEVGTSAWMDDEKIKALAQKETMQDIEAEAVQYADDCTRQCQPSSRAADLAPLFKNSSEAMKAFLQFQTSLNVIWQNLRYDIPYAIKQKQFNRIAGTVCGYVFAGIFMNSVMEGIFNGAGDDDDKKGLQALRNLIYYSTTQFTDAVPMLGSEITNTLDQLITGKRGFMQSGTDMTPSATKFLSALNRAKSGKWKKAAELTAEGIGLYLGAPVSGVKEIHKLLGKPLDEGNIDILRGISDVYGSVGDIIDIVQE